jgi:hypothetical protein
MALALLVIPTSDDARDPLQTLLKRVKADYASLERYWKEFDPQPQNGPPSTTTSTYRMAEGKLTSLKRLVRKLSLDYPQEARRTYRVVLRDEKVQVLWQELGAEMDSALEAIDLIGPESYTRVRVWRILRQVILVYSDLIEVLEDKLRREPR